MTYIPWTDSPLGLIIKGMNDKELNQLAKKFGEKIRAERARTGKSQEDLAFTSGLDRTYISGIERGIRNPSLKNIGKIAKALQIPISRLFDLK